MPLSSVDWATAIPWAVISFLVVVFMAGFLFIGLRLHVIFEDIDQARGTRALKMRRSMSTVGGGKFGQGDQKMLFVFLTLILLLWMAQYYRLFSKMEISLSLHGIERRMMRDHHPPSDERDSSSEGIFF